MASTNNTPNISMGTASNTERNEIGKNGILWAGIILISITLLGVIAMIAHWPDKMPPTNTGNVCTKYQYKLFHINYLGPNGVADEQVNFVNTPKPVAIIDSPKLLPTDTTNSDSNISKQNVADNNATMPKIQVNKCIACKSGCTIDLNTLILLLVALGGFLGNMIHIASSFTNFIGAEKFKRSWMLWYFVKPFTAAALAVGVYIIFRAGFLNSTEATSSVNLYGVIAIALLSGLFTDMATQKLKEVFGVVFQSSTTRPNPLDLPPVKITSVNPATIPLNVLTQIVISGIGFENRIIKIKINVDDIKDPEIKPNAITFMYTATAENPKLVLSDEKGTELASYDLVTSGTTNVPVAATVTVTDIQPDNLTLNALNLITITGTGLDTAGIAVSVDGNPIADADITKTATALTFNHTPPANGAIPVIVADANGNVLKTKSLTC